jgi:hypothetical protein
MPPCSRRFDTRRSPVALALALLMCTSLRCAASSLVAIIVHVCTIIFTPISSVSCRSVLAIVFGSQVSLDSHSRQVSHVMFVFSRPPLALVR